MIIYRVTQYKKKRGLYGNRQYKGPISEWYMDFNRNTHPNMRFGSISEHVAIQFIAHALEIDRIQEDTKLVLTKWEVPDQFAVVNPRLRPCSPSHVIDSEVVFYPRKGRVVSRRVRSAKEFVNECSQVG